MATEALRPGFGGVEAILVAHGYLGQKQQPMLISVTGLSWQARGTARSVPSGASTRASAGEGGGRRA